VVNFERVASSLIVVCTACLLVRLAVLRTVSIFRFLFAYLVILAAEIVILRLVPLRSNVYGYLYICAQSLNLLVACGAVGEIYARALAGRAGLAAFGRSVVGWAIAAALLLAVLSMALDSQVLPGQSAILHRFFALERSGNFVLLLLLLMVSVYLTWFPVRVPRNVVIYAGGFAIFFLARTAGILAVNLLPQEQLRMISNAMLAVQIACLVFWIWGFRQESEDRITVTGHRWDPSQMERLTSQLDSINAALERLSRR